MTATRTARRRNVYAGTCTACQEQVAPYAGTLAGKVDGRWTVVHDRCPAVEQAEYEAAQAARTAQFNAALDELATYNFTDQELVELRILRAAQSNGYVADKLAVVQAGTDQADALRRLSGSSQGMTMDYITEYSRERTANELAHAWVLAHYQAEVA